MKRKVTFSIINQMREAREKGLSISEIKSLVGLGYGTVHRYIHNVKILPQYIAILENKRKGSIKRKSIAMKLAKVKAEKDIPELTDKEKILILSSLYWAEGSKKDFGLSNTDPYIIKIFFEILTHIFKIEIDKIKISIRIYEDLNREKCIQFWSQALQISPEKISGINVLKGKKRGKLEHGMCRIRVLKGGDLLKYVFAVKFQTIKLMSL